MGKKSRKGSSTGGGEEFESVDKLEEVRRSLKIRSGKRKEKVKLPSGITADYSSAFFAQLDRGNEEIISGNTTTVIDLNNGDVYERHHNQLTTSSAAVSATFTSHSDNSSDNSINLHSAGTNKPSLPPVPPRIPKRGILKGSKSSLHNTNDSDSRVILMRNTLQNERMGDEVRKQIGKVNHVRINPFIFRLPSTVNYHRITM